jgi:hypothetical protein
MVGTGMTAINQQSSFKGTHEWVEQVELDAGRLGLKRVVVEQVGIGHRHKI